MGCSLICVEGMGILFFLFFGCIIAHDIGFLMSCGAIFSPSFRVVNFVKPILRRMLELKTVISCINESS
jgi:hypothetical protein